jgi:hypothetical protein
MYLLCFNNFLQKNWKHKTGRVYSRIHHILQFKIFYFSSLLIKIRLNSIWKEFHYLESYNLGARMSRTPILTTLVAEVTSTPEKYISVIIINYSSMT